MNMGRFHSVQSACSPVHLADVVNTVLQIKREKEYTEGPYLAQWEEKKI